MFVGADIHHALPHPVSAVTSRETGKTRGKIREWWPGRVGWRDLWPGLSDASARKRKIGTKGCINYYRLHRLLHVGVSIKKSGLTMLLVQPHCERASSTWANG